jgi:hypothetical protein
MSVLDCKPTNPKDALAVTKAPVALVPPVAIFNLAEALDDGALKYGPYNWRETGVRASVYLSAIQRHWGLYLDGEVRAADSGVHHLAHIMGCCAILLDAESLGVLEDDRPSAGASSEVLSSVSERMVSRRNL